MTHADQALHVYLQNVLDGQTGIALEMDKVPEDLRDFAGDLVHFVSLSNQVEAQLVQIRTEYEEHTARIEATNTSMEQFSLLISTLIQYVPQQILLIEKESHGIMLMNEAAIREVHRDFDYVEHITALMSKYEIPPSGVVVEIHYKHEDVERHLHVVAYTLNWEGTDAVIYAITDISETKKEIAELEIYAYHDSLTNLYNRTFGMKTLEKWIEEKKSFILLFADLDKLKRINDVFGHNEGDTYIITAAKHLRALCKDAIVCRLGGDEFMVLIPGIGDEEAQRRAAEVCASLENDPYLEGKEFSYGMSFGFVLVDENNDLPSRTILSIADEKMYENKRARKQERRD